MLIRGIGLVVFVRVGRGGAKIVSVIRKYHNHKHGIARQTWKLKKQKQESRSFLYKLC